MATNSTAAAAQRRGHEAVEALEQQTEFSVGDRSALGQRADDAGVGGTVVAQPGLVSEGYLGAALAIRSLAFSIEIYPRQPKWEQACMDGALAAF